MFDQIFNELKSKKYHIREELGYTYYTSEDLTVEAEVNLHFNTCWIEYKGQRAFGTDLISTTKRLAELLSEVGWQLDHHLQE